MEITYNIEIVPETKLIIDLYNSSNINRPTSEFERITKMYANSNLIISAWDEEQLVGIARSLTDFSYCCYLSDLAVRESYKNRGIGTKLIKIIKGELVNNVCFSFFMHHQRWGIIQKLDSKV